MFIDGKVHNMPKVSKLCTEEVYNLRVLVFKYSLPDLHKSVFHKSVPLPTSKIMLNWQ